MNFLKKIYNKEKNWWNLEKLLNQLDGILKFLDLKQLKEDYVPYLFEILKDNTFTVKKKCANSLVKFLQVNYYSSLNSQILIDLNK